MSRVPSREPLVHGDDGQLLLVAAPIKKRSSTLAIMGVLAVMLLASALAVVFVFRPNHTNNRATAPAQPPVWPLPQNVSLGGQTFSLDPSTFAITTNSLSPRLAATVSRYQGAGWIFDVAWKNNFNLSKVADSLTSLKLIVKSDNETLLLRTDESYTLSVGAGQANITSNTIYGAVRGLETFAQLVQRQRSTNGTTYSIQSGTIFDTPRLPYRGIMVDVSRHFIEVPRLHQIIDSMAVNKLNVLLIHLSDDQSFPFASLTHPNLTRPLGPGLVYTHQDFAALNQHASELGILVQVELDMPAHASSWSGEPQLLICGDVPGSGLVNPMLDYTWQVIEDLSRELRGLFSFATFDLGGDEVADYCWTNSPKLMAWKAAQNISNLVCYFHEQQALAAVRGGYKHFAMWEDARDCGNIRTMAPDTLIDVWDQSGTDYWKLYDVPDVIKDGWTQIIISSGCYFLRHFEWENNYLCDVQNVSGITAAQRDYIIGGHGSRWGEETTTQSWFNDSYPGLASVAEKLWSAGDQTIPTNANLDLAATRLKQLVCRMQLLKMGPFDTAFGPWPFSWCS
eukprot:c39136_g1_i1.p1 GENE.c39136_g1_i1~~c39136_g1_i1.p1  ORF type:complete len:566 (-),score=119.28 c39136_g1_i1:129-1826(-)